MSMFTLESSNPALQGAQRLQGSASGHLATLGGVVQNSATLFALAVVSGALAWLYLPATGSILMVSALAAMGVGIGLAFYLAGNPAMAGTLAPVYAIVEGVFLGLLTSVLDSALLSSGLAVAGGSLAIPAMVITVSCAGSMFTLYSLGVLRPTERFQSTVKTLTMAVFAAYLVMFLLSFAGIEVPFLSLSSAAAGGTSALIGLGLNAAILVLASLWFIIDFGHIEQMIERGASKEMEWYGAFILLVTLAWVYYEAVKLCFRLALLFSSRD